MVFIGKTGRFTGGKWSNDNNTVSDEKKMKK